MHPRQLVPPELLALAALQGGAVTREQALALGLGPRAIERLVRDGVWIRLCPGVYLAYAGGPSWLSLAWAGVLVGGDHARLGAAAAGHRHALVVEPPPAIVVLTPYGTGARSADGPWDFRRERPGVRSARSVGQPPSTTLEDTVLDLVDAAPDEATVVDVVTRAVQGRRTSAASLLAAASGRHRLGNRRLLVVLLADVADGVRSPLELDFLRDVERAHQLPQGRRQARQRGTEVDVSYDDYGTVVELDGRLGHVGRGRFRDMARDNAATTSGQVTLRYGHADVHGRPCAVAGQLGSVLGIRGWPGPVVPCRRCRRAHAV